VTPKDHLAFAIGKIIWNLHSLEYALRLFLWESVGPKDPAFHPDQLSVNDKVAVNPITNYDSLGDLIMKVNKYLETLGKSERIDRSVVDLRDAIAHGRVVSFHPTGPFRMLKFSKPKSGYVSVTTVVELTPDWLADQVKRTYSEVAKVAFIGRSLGLPFFELP
jgi:hypothetical protein